MVRVTYTIRRCGSYVALLWDEGLYLFLLHLLVTYSINARLPLSFHAVSFGPDERSAILRRMVEIAQEVESSAPQNSLANRIPSSYTRALDSVSVERFQPSEIDTNFIRSI
jgi:hypothetical protein